MGADHLFYSMYFLKNLMEGNVLPYVLPSPPSTRRICVMIFWNVHVTEMIMIFLGIQLFNFIIVIHFKFRYYEWTKMTETFF